MSSDIHRMNRLNLFKWHQRITLIALMTALLMVHACSPKRILTPIVPDRAVDQVLSSMHAAEATFDFFSARFSGSVNYGGGQTDIGGTIRIRKDSAVFISVAPFLGIEVARILITPDHVKMVNRLESTYFEGDMELINGMLNADLDFYMLQSMLLGNDLPHFSTHNFSLEEDHDMILLHNPRRSPIDPLTQAYGSIEQKLWLDKHTFRILQTNLYEKDTERNIQARYPSHSIVQGRSFPSEVLLFFSDAASAAHLSVSYSRILIDQPQQITFSIPPRYTPMDF
jgi:outer membrane lipoprotein-sorting protein